MMSSFLPLKVFSWGDAKVVPSTVQDLCGCHVHFISARHEDSVVILHDHAMHSFGDSGFAQALRAVGDVQQVAFGNGHCVGLTSQGTVVAAGSNQHGQVGTGAGDRRAVSLCTTPPALLTRKITQVAAGKAHSVALSACGDVYTWGLGYSGQLGLGPDNEIAMVPSYVNRLHQVCCLYPRQP